MVGDYNSLIQESSPNLASSVVEIEHHHEDKLHDITNWFASEAEESHEEGDSSKVKAGSTNVLGHPLQQAENVYTEDQSFHNFEEEEAEGEEVQDATPERLVGGLEGDTSEETEEEPNSKPGKEVPEGLDAKLLKSLDTPVKFHALSTPNAVKQESHNPYKLQGHGVLASHKRPFTSFKDFLREKQQSEAKVHIVSSTGEFRQQEVSQNAPPSDPGSYTGGESLAEVPGKIRKQIVRLPYTAEQQVRRAQAKLKAGAKKVKKIVV